MKAFKTLANVFLAPIMIPLRTIRTAKMAASQIKSDLSAIGTIPEAEAEKFSRPDDWESAAHSAAKAARGFIFVAAAIWAFMTYKIATHGSLLLIYNLLFFSLMMVVVSLQNSLQCLRLRENRMAKIKDVLHDKNWFPEL